MRSSYYGAFQTLQRLKRIDEAKQSLEMFQKLADNPQARSAEIKYSRMGPKAEAMTVRATPPASGPRTGRWFAEPVQGFSEGIVWASSDTPARRPSISACDLDADGDVDLFLSSASSSSDVEAQNVVLEQNGDAWNQRTDHPLAKVADVNAALWGDYDNDSLVDVYLCRAGPNQLWRQVEAGRWDEVTESTQTAGGEFDTVDGALFDADHDGDLDLWLVNADGKNELLNNNLDGTFRPIAAAQGIAGEDVQSTGVVVTDLDNDRDADLIVLNKGAPHEVFLNDRLWNYSKAEGFDEFVSTSAFAAVAADIDADGNIELITSSSDGWRKWVRAEDGTWSAMLIRLGGTDVKPGAGPIAVQDINGDGRLDIVASTQSGWAVLDCFGEDAKVLLSSEADTDASWGLVNVDPGSGYSLVDASGGQPRLWSPGEGRYPFADVLFSGKESKADQMRSNASGIGIQAAARVGGRWTALQTFRDQSGPGQSSQPLAIGLGDERSIGFVKLLWPDGLFQTELGLAAGKTHRIEETQRQVSSCPVLFVWNGENYEFVSDVLGVGGLGFNGGRGVYHDARPWENLMLPLHLPAVTEAGSIRLKIGEPMEEACYLDAIRLVTYDLPAGWNMTMDERQAVNAPFATGKPIFYRQVLEPVVATDTDGNDVRGAIRAADGQPLPAGKRDPRFLAHTEPFSITLKFDQPLDDLNGRPVLVIDGWVEYPYSQTMFASWQANASYEAPTLEARSVGGEWQVVYEQFGYPAGMPRQMSVPIEKEDLPDGTIELRLSTTMEVYWDRMFVAVEEPCDGAERTELALQRATVSEVGFPQRINGDFRKPFYDYRKRAPLWDTRHAPGYYTNFGEATPLLAQVDDAVAIIGPGEEVEFEFSGPDQSGASGRVFVLECHGWCKDMDLYTEHGETLGPLPRRKDTNMDRDQEAARRELLDRFNQRFRAG